MKKITICMVAVAALVCHTSMAQIRLSKTLNNTVTPATTQQTQKVLQTAVPATESKPGGKLGGAGSTNPNVGATAVTDLKANAVEDAFYSQTITSTDGSKVTVGYDNVVVRNSNIKFVSPPQRRIIPKVRSISQDENNDWNCKVENVQVKITNDSYMRVPVASIASNIYPGAIYKFNNFINGSWKTETADRNPITISTSVKNITNGSVFETVNQPNRNTIRQAIANLYGRFTRRPEEIANLGFKYRSEEISTASDLDIKVGAYGYGGGFSGSNNFNFTRKDNTHTFLVDCTKEMFTMDADMPEAGLFTNPLQAPAYGEAMMYISTVTYGLRVLALVEIAISDEKMNNDFKANYDGIVAGGEASLDFMKKVQNNNIKISMFVVGGQGNTVYQAYNIEGMKTRLEDISKTLNYNTSEAIEYQFRNINNEVVQCNSVTDNFIRRVCEPKAESAKPANFEVKVNELRFTNSNQHDIDLYGDIWAEIIDGNGNTIYSQEYLKGTGGYMMHLQANQNIADETINNRQYDGYFRSFNFNIGAGAVPGCRMKIHYWLMDRDGTTFDPDDHLIMAGKSQPDFCTNNNNCRDFPHYTQIIELDNVKLSNSYNQFSVTFTDSDGDNPFEIIMGVTKGMGNK